MSIHVLILSMVKKLNVEPGKLINFLVTKIFFIEFLISWFYCMIFINKQVFVTEGWVGLKNQVEEG